VLLFLICHFCYILPLSVAIATYRNWDLRKSCEAHQEDPVPGYIRVFAAVCVLSGWVSCDHGMARPQVDDRGDGLHMRKAAANILNTQLWTTDNWRYSRLGLGVGLATPHGSRICNFDCNCLWAWNSVSDIKGKGIWDTALSRIIVPKRDEARIKGGWSERGWDGQGI
jgi:hypothetical protein